MSKKTKIGLNGVEVKEQEKQVEATKNNNSDSKVNLRVYFKGRDIDWIHIPNVDKYEANQNSDWVRVFRKGNEIATFSSQEVKSIYWTTEGSPDEERKKRLEQELKEEQEQKARLKEEKAKNKKFFGWF